MQRVDAYVQRDRNQQQQELHIAVKVNALQSTG